jgi:hypothetical protein
MALTPGSTSYSGDTAIYNVSSGSWNHTTLTGEDSLWVHVALYGSAGRVVTGITFNGDAMTLAKSVVSTDTQYQSCWYYIVNPDIGTYAIEVTYNGTGYGAGGAIAFTGTRTSSPLGTTDSLEYSGTNPSKSITTILSKSYVLQGMSISNVTPQTVTMGDGETKLYDFNPGSGWRGQSTYKGTLEYGSYTMSETFSNSTSCVMALVEVKSQITDIAYTLTVAVGSFILTGVAAILGETARKIIVSVGSFVLTLKDFLIDKTKYTFKSKNTSTWSFKDKEDY